MHIGGAIRNVAGAAPDTDYQLRTDVSSTLFLNEPEDYDGGELVTDRAVDEISMMTRLFMQFPN